MILTGEEGSGRDKVVEYLAEHLGLHYIETQSQVSHHHVNVSLLQSYFKIMITQLVAGIFK